MHYAYPSKVTGGWYIFSVVSYRRGGTRELVDIVIIFKVMTSLKISRWERATADASHKHDRYVHTWQARTHRNNIMTYIIIIICICYEQCPDIYVYYIIIIIYTVVVRTKRRETIHAVLGDWRQRERQTSI